MIFAPPPTEIAVGAIVVKRTTEVIATVAGALALAVIATPATAKTVFNFESTPIGVSSSLSLTDLGVTMTVMPEGYSGGSVNVLNPYVALLGNHAVAGSKLSYGLGLNQFAPLRFSFDKAISSITFAAGDSGGDSDDPIVISAYDAASTFLGSVSTSYPAGYGNGKLLTLNFAHSRYFITSSGFGLFNQDSVLYDVTALTTGGVPEPTTWAMLIAGFGLVGVAARRRSSVVTA